MASLLKYPDMFLTQEGKELKSQVTMQAEHYDYKCYLQRLSEHVNNKPVLACTTSESVPSANSFMNSFTKLYKENNILKVH